MTPEQDAAETAIQLRAIETVDYLAKLADAIGVEKIRSAAVFMKLYAEERMNFTEISKVLGVSVTAGAAMAWKWHDTGLVYAKRPERGSHEDQRFVVVKLQPATRMKIKKFLARENELDNIGLEE